MTIENPMFPPPAAGSATSMSRRRMLAGGLAAATAMPAADAAHTMPATAAGPSIEPDDPPLCGTVGATALRAPAVERMAHADIGINLQPGIQLPLTDAAVLPAQYAMKVEGTCMSPLIEEGTEVVFSKSAEIMPGAIVVVWRRPERTPPGERQAIIKRAAGPVLTELIPYVRGPITNVTPLLFLRYVNPPGCMVVGYDDILAVHACLGTVAKKPRQPKRSGQRGGAKS